MKKWTSIKPILLVGTLLLSGISGWVIAQDKPVSQATDEVTLNLASPLPTTKADRITYFQNLREQFSKAGNTAAADYCDRVLENLQK